MVVIYPSGGGDLPNLNTSPRAPVGAKKGDQRLKLECIDYIFSFMLHACLHQLHKKNAVSIQMSIEMNDLPDRSIEIV